MAEGLEVVITNVKPPHRTAFATVAPNASRVLTAAAADGAPPQPKAPNPHIARFAKLCGITLADVEAHGPDEYVVAPGLADVIADTEKRGA